MLNLEINRKLMSPQNYDLKYLDLSFKHYFDLYIMARRIKLLVFATKSNEIQMKWPFMANFSQV